MEKSIFDLFETIFAEDPKPPKSILLEIDILDSNSCTEISSTKISDIFEIFLHMLVYGFNKLELNISIENINLLNKYFNSVGINILVEFELFDTILFKDPRYVNRYCIVNNLSSSYFMMNVKNQQYNNLNELIAIYQIEYEYLVFIRFDFI
jgi:hypothetical protein